MSLLGSIQLAGNTLQAMQIGLQVVGQNIANANTPGYVREEVNYVTAPTYQFGTLTLGLGVRVAGIVQKLDDFLQGRTRDAASDRAASEAQEKAYGELEAIIGELNDTDLSSSLSSFFNSIHDVLTDPTSDAARNLATLRGRTLAQDVANLSTRARNVQTSYNEQVAGSADDINRLLQDIGTLNVRIAQVEGSGGGGNDAVGLRDRRGQALAELSELLNLEISEEPSGSVNVIAQGEFLVTGGIVREVSVGYQPGNGISAAYLQIADTQATISPAGGEVAGLIAGRDEILGGFLDTLDEFAGTLAFEFNKLFSSGQGLNGYQSVTSENAVLDTDAALDEAGLPFAPVNGSFEIQVYTPSTGQTQRTRVQVDLDGLGTDTSLESLAAALQAISGVTATVTSSGRLQLESETSDQQIAFADDSSGVLAALGINTFFTGSSALNLGVNQAIIDDPKKFAASKNGIGEDTDNAVDLAGFGNRQLASQSNASLLNLYERMVGDVSQGASVSKSVADGYRTFEQSIAGQAFANSGVSIDEETIKLLAYQRTYQASAKYISVIDELLQVLVSL